MTQLDRRFGVSLGVSVSTEYLLRRDSSPSHPLLKLPIGIHILLHDRENQLCPEPALLTSMATLTSTEWNVRVQCREHELGQSFNVLIFLGTVPELQDDWQTSPSLVGVHAVYTWTGDVPEEEDQEVEGFVPLQRALGRRANLPALSEEYVVPYLTKELRWRVQKVR